MINRRNTGSIDYIPSESFVKALNEVRQMNVNVVDDTSNQNLVELAGYGISAPEDQIRDLLAQLKAESEAYNKSGATMLKAAMDERIGHLEQALAAHCAKKGDAISPENVWAAAYPKRGGSSSTVPAVNADVVPKSVKVVTSEGQVPYKDGSPGDEITNDKKSAVGEKPSQVITNPQGAIKKPYLGDPSVSPRLTGRY